MTAVRSAPQWTHCNLLTRGRWKQADLVSVDTWTSNNNSESDNCQMADICPYRGDIFAISSGYVLQPSSISSVFSELRLSQLVLHITIHWESHSTNHTFWVDHVEREHECWMKHTEHTLIYASSLILSTALCIQTGTVRGPLRQKKVTPRWALGSLIFVQSN